MGIEILFIAAGTAMLIAVLVSRRMLQAKTPGSKQELSGLESDSVAPDEAAKALKKLPLLRGDGRFAFKAVGSIPFAPNFDSVRIARRIYFVEPEIIEVLLVPDADNAERKNAISVTVDSLVLGYVPTQEASEMSKYLAAHSSGMRAKAKIYLGSRAEYNGVMLDLAKPVRLESKRNSK
jgi:hypothetical protein